jgi:hypothetical protein
MERIGQSLLWPLQWLVWHPGRIAVRRKIGDKFNWPIFRLIPFLVNSRASDVSRVERSLTTTGTKAAGGGTRFVTPRAQRNRPPPGVESRLGQLLLPAERPARKAARRLPRQHLTPKPILHRISLPVRHRPPPELRWPQLHASAGKKKAAVGGTDTVGLATWYCRGASLGLRFPSGMTLTAMILVAVTDFRRPHESAHSRSGLIHR